MQTVTYTKENESSFGTNLFFMLLGVGFIGAGVYFAHRAWTAKSWPTTKGVVVAHSIERSPGRGGGRPDAVVTYEYVVDGVQYTSDRIRVVSFVPSWDYTEPFKDHPIGSTVRVHYDPDDPGYAILYPSPAYGANVVLIFGGFLLFFGGWKERSRRTAARRRYQPPTR